MKLFKLAALISLLMISTTGCNLKTNSLEGLSKSPEELIEDKPIYSEDKKEIYDEIKSKLPYKSNFLLPVNSKEVGIINNVDFDKDGIDEIIGFEKKELNSNEQKNEVGFIILKKNPDGSYTEIDSLLQYGEAIEYVNFYDLNNDGNLEIIMSIKEQEKTNIYIYEYKDEEINLVYEIKPTWIEDNNNLTDVKLKVGYLNNDDVLDVLMLNFNPTKNKVYVSVLNFKDGKTVLDMVEFDNIKNFNNLFVTVDNISKNQIGIILDIPIISDNNYYITQILYLEDNKIIKVFNEDDKSIRKSTYNPPEDINKDKVVEIPITSGDNSTFTSKQSSTISWYRWNGKNGDEASLLFNSQIYYNYQYNFKLEIPNNLVNKFYVDQEESGEKAVFKFFYHDDITLQTKNLFTIHLTQKSLVDENKNLNTTNGVVLAENYDYSFILYLNDVEQLDTLNITPDALKKYFSLMY
ncbi:MAG: hypothetical protein ACRDA3_16440 [Peptostreptococcaceae bacterium]